jgi:hypothetical protein
MSELYIVDNLDEFTESTRKVVYNSFGKNAESEDDAIDQMFAKLDNVSLEELNKVLTQQESMVIVKNLLKKQTNKHTNQIRYVLDEEIFLKIVEALNTRLVSNLLSSLVSKGLIESAYDHEINDFVFWCKEDETPETD